MYYGGHAAYGRDFELGGAWGRPGTEHRQTGRPFYQGYGRQGESYERDRVPRRGMRYAMEFAQEPFLPEDAYDRHPELDQARPRQPDRRPWSEHDADTGWELDDGELRRAVRQNLYQDSWIDADRIDVEVSDGVVTLSGEVNDFMEARYAWDDAWETEGVRGVLNQLTVRTDEPAGGEQTVLRTDGPAAAGG